MNIKNNLYEALINRGKILSRTEINQTIKKYEDKFNDKKRVDLLKYLSRQKYIKRIFSGFYYINNFDERNRNFSEFEDKELVFLVLDKLRIKWYVGLGYSLYLQGKRWQTPNQISIVNTKFSGIKKIFGLKVKFFKTKEKFIFGLKTAKTTHDIKYFYSDPAKTHIDIVYFKEADNLIRVKNTKKYLRGYPKWVGQR